MGISTVQQLIVRGSSQNDYNNSGIDTNAKWVDAFNTALQDLVSDINLTGSLSISFVAGTREYDLPDNFFELQELRDSFKCRVGKRRTYDPYFGCPQGYWIMNRGSNYAIDLYEYSSDETFTGIYTRYPAALAVADIATQKPDIPTIGENALIYYAISKALRANNQLGQAQALEASYEMERRKIRDAAARAMMGGS